jgi:hypothetical protein
MELQRDRPGERILQIISASRLTNATWRPVRFMNSVHLEKRPDRKVRFI